MKNFNLKRVLIFFILFLSLGQLEAQNVPGYQGKRLWVEYQASLDMVEVYNLGVNVYHSMNIKYALKRNLALGISANYQYGKFDSESDFLLNLHDVPVEMKSILFGINIETYSKARGSIAPIGFYWIYDFKVGFKDYIVESKYEEWFIGKYGSLQAMDWSIGIGIGERYIFKNGIVLNFHILALGLRKSDPFSYNGTRLISTGAIGVGYMIK